MISEQYVLDMVHPAIRTTGKYPTKVLTGGVENPEELLNDVKWSTYLSETRKEPGRHDDSDGRILIVASNDLCVDAMLAGWVLEQRIDDRADILPVVAKGSRLFGEDGPDTFDRWLDHFPRFDTMMDNATDSAAVSQFMASSLGSYKKSIVACTVETLPIVGGALTQKHPDFDVIVIFNDRPYSGEVTSISRMDISGGQVSFPVEVPIREPYDLTAEDKRFIKAIHNYKQANSGENASHLFSRAEQRYMKREDTLLALIDKENDRVPFRGHTIDLLTRSVKQRAAVRVTPQLAVEFGSSSACLLRYPSR